MCVCVCVCVWVVRTTSGKMSQNCDNGGTTSGPVKYEAWLHSKIKFKFVSICVCVCVCAHVCMCVCEGM